VTRREEGGFGARRRSEPTRLLVVGAGEAGRSLVREALDAEAPLQPVAFLDDDPDLIGTEVEGLPVLGGLPDLPRHARDIRASEILIAIPSADGALIRRLVLLCRRAGLPFNIVPGLRAIVEGEVHFDQVRAVAPEDLLGREMVALSAGSAAGAVRDRSVLITGAGGSIGAELCRQLLAFGPRELLLLGRGENSLLEIAGELAPAAGATALHTLVADIRDRRRLEVLAERHRPDLVFHSAAHKHVPLMEDSPEEAVIVNVGGTANLIDFARRVGAERFVLISTDKAVRPCSVMGASKKVAELLVRAAAADGSPTRFMTVRFGNVLGSRGSVVPFFLERIRRGLPLPVTHAEMTRYFMTIKEAVLLVVQAMVLGENGATYVLEMGDPVSILELARNLLALSGFDPDNEDEGPGIEVTGLRPGERLHESLWEPDERSECSANPLIHKALAETPAGFDAGRCRDELLAPALDGDPDGVRRALDRWLGSSLAAAE
jgi:FlaA1/EpsC-like NDP-sugar epimerase